VHQLRAERRTRAREEPLDIRWDARLPFLGAEVRNPRHHTRYHVYLPLFPSREGAMCTCPDFALRREIGTCKHVEAALLALEEEPVRPAVSNDPGPGAERLWARIDERLRGAKEGTEPRTIWIRRPGAVLFERIES
jgi:hypothetical protein